MRESVEVGVVLELDECHVDGSEFGSEYDVVFVEACGVDKDGCLSRFVEYRSSQLGVGVDFGAVCVYPVLRIPPGCPGSCSRGCLCVGCIWSVGGDW